jgi:predicted RNase H-like HicB family nuclease
MASTSDGHDDETGGVEFIFEEDGCVTARDTETGIASYGESKAEALRMLAEALEIHDGGGEPVSDDDLREFGLDPAEQNNKELPEFMN